ncbi:MAG: hypothetical protein HQ566_05880 [Candidatus Omnitrophica bacterium]|nr:hypothetical protein [Candidatus Omnitrophota bacterium]
MKKIEKALYFKIVAICVSICFIVDTTIYAAPTLRMNLMFDNTDKENRSERGLSAILKEQQIRDVLQSLRPDFGEKKELSGKEFEAHIKKLAEDLNIDYSVRREGATRFFEGVLQDASCYLHNRDFIGVLSTLFRLLILSGQPRVGFSYKDRIVQLMMVGPSMAILPLAVAVTTAIFFSLPLNVFIASHLYVYYDC